MSLENKSENVDIVRFGSLVTCTESYIDQRFPGVEHKEVFGVIGNPPATENTNQSAQLNKHIGFKVGGMILPTLGHNSLHAHNTAEVFIVQSGILRFYWGEYGNAGEAVLQKGDIFNTPSNLFRSFENIGSEHASIISVLGGEKPKVLWPEHILTSARETGLILGSDGKCYDLCKGEKLPDGITAIEKYPDSELAKMVEAPAKNVIPQFIARYYDLRAYACDDIVEVVGEEAVLPDRPGFAISFITEKTPLPEEGLHASNYEVISVIEDYWTLSVEGEENRVLDPLDVALVPPNKTYRLFPCRSGHASLYIFKKTNDPAGSMRRVEYN